MVEVLDISEWPERPPGVDRIHFSCNGAITLLATIPEEVLRVDDTASGTDPSDAACFLWRCAELFPQQGARWNKIEGWTQERSKSFVEAADLVIVVGYSSEEYDA